MKRRFLTHIKKDQVYYFTFLGLSIITLFVSYFSMNSLLNITTNHFLKSQIESSRREAKEIASLIQYQIEQGVSKEIVINNLQKSIENISVQSGFICMFNKYGVEICHPNPHKIGQQTLPKESFVQPLVEKEIHPEDFYSLLKNEKEIGGVRKFMNTDRVAEVIYLYPVKSTDWIIAAHADIEYINSKMKLLKINFILVYFISGIVIIILSLFMVRLINRKYEKILEIQNEDLTDKVLSLSKLNTDLLVYKEKFIEKDKKVSRPSVKKRLITYVKDEIVSIEQDDIAFIYTENTLTYIFCANGNIYHSGSSLEEIFTDLSSSLFFRANRQFIISINTITKIYKYGNNQLKIEMTPRSPINIIISKNKASEFKKWLRGDFNIE